MGVPSVVGIPGDFGGTYPMREHVLLAKCAPCVAAGDFTPCSIDGVQGMGEGFVGGVGASEGEQDQSVALSDPCSDRVAEITAAFGADHGRAYRTCPWAGAMLQPMDVRRAVMKTDGRPAERPSATRRARGSDESCMRVEFARSADQPCGALVAARPLLATPFGQLLVLFPESCWCRRLHPFHGACLCVDSMMPCRG